MGRFTDLNIGTEVEEMAMGVTKELGDLMKVLDARYAGTMQREYGIFQAAVFKMLGDCLLQDVDVLGTKENRELYSEFLDGILRNQFTP